MLFQVHIQIAETVEFRFASGYCAWLRLILTQTLFAENEFNHSLLLHSWFYGLRQFNFHRTQNVLFILSQMLLRTTWNCQTEALTNWTNVWHFGMVKMLSKANLTSNYFINNFVNILESKWCFVSWDEGFYQILSVNNRFAGIFSNSAEGISIYFNLILLSFIEKVLSTKGLVHCVAWTLLFDAWATFESNLYLSLMI